MHRIKTVIMGAAGRDFHNFNTVYRDNEAYDVVAFTATQIPNIDGRKYPASLAGRLYPKGIPIVAEETLEALIRKHKVEEVVFAYSDVPYTYVMSRSSIANACGAHFKLLGAQPTMITSTKPVISVCAVRTGSGKSQTSRRVAHLLQRHGLKVAAVRHPMPYGDLEKQKVQRYGSLADLKKHKCTIEEMEEYEPHIVEGIIIYAGVDYGAILEQAQAEADVILWDGGNNDMPFYKPDLAHRRGRPAARGQRAELLPGRGQPADGRRRHHQQDRQRRAEGGRPAARQHPQGQPEGDRRRRGVAHLRRSPRAADRQAGAGGRGRPDADARRDEDRRRHRGRPEVRRVASWSTRGRTPCGRSPRPSGSTRTSGCCCRRWATATEQVKDLETTINKVPCDVVVIGTPIDLNRIVKIRKPTVRVTYQLQEIGTPNLEQLVGQFVKKYVKK